MPPSAHLSTLLAPFQSLFTAPTWRKVQRLIVGTILARGRRTVTAALRHTGQQDTPSFSLYHQVFNRARWSALKGSRRLLSVLMQTPVFTRAGSSRPLAAASPSSLTKHWSDAGADASTSAVITATPWLRAASVPSAPVGYAGSCWPWSSHRPGAAALGPYLS